MSTYTETERQLLLGVAHVSIERGLEEKDPIPPSLHDYPERLCRHGASFVTLTIDSALRGCIGTLEACQPLIVDVAHNAFSAAFNDPRFSPLVAKEYPKIAIHISILSPHAPMVFSSEGDLVQQLRPGVDGLILSDKGRRGTFLPSVWEEISEPAEFVRHLKAKAGFPAQYWSPTLTMDRYTVDVVE